MNAKVEAIRKWAMANYEKGGDIYVEAYTDAMLDANFKSLADAKRWAKTYKEIGDDIRAA